MCYNKEEKTQTNTMLSLCTCVFLNLLIQNTGHYFVLYVIFYDFRQHSLSHAEGIHRKFFISWSILYHVHLACNIYCTHVYLYRCDSTVFSFLKLKSRRLNFLINCRSNLSINIVSRAKKMRKE